MVATGETPEIHRAAERLASQTKAEKDALVAKANSKDANVDDLLADAADNEAQGQRQESRTTKSLRDAKKDAKDFNIKAGLYTTASGGRNWRSS